MIDITKIIETNKEYVKQHPELPKAGLTSHPTKKLGIVTCMDTRLVGMLEEATDSMGCNSDYHVCYRSHLCLTVSRRS